MDLLWVAAAVVVGMVVGVVAYQAGKRRRATTPVDMRRLDEYEFYPFVVNESGHIEFDAERFQQAVDYLLEHRNPTAARELIVVGEQNFVRDTFATQALDRYKSLFATYDGESVIDDNEAYLENYKRIVRLIGRSFPNTGIEILLHNLVNPSRSIVAIENGEVTGRTLEMGTTKLVLDLKTRRYHNQDKLNYELDLGARRFKCTTIPIFRPEYGLVGAICINVDARFLREEVLPNPERLEAVFDNLLKADLTLDENILSPDEYQAALRGKRHFLDEAIRAPSGPRTQRQLAVILFSDIADYTAHMQRDETGTLGLVEANGRIHRGAIAAHRGRLLKEMGDGVLASFGSVGDAVEAALAIQAEVKADGRYSIRIGLHLGEVILSDGDIYGDGVNIASRVHGLAPPGGIVLSKVVFDNVRDREGLTFVDLGEQIVKNIEQPVHLFELAPGRV